MVAKNMTTKTNNKQKKTKIRWCQKVQIQIFIENYVLSQNLKKCDQIKIGGEKSQDLCCTKTKIIKTLFYFWNAPKIEPLNIFFSHLLH